MKTATLVAMGFTVILTSSSFAGTVADSSKEPVTTPPPPDTGAGPFIGAVAGEFWVQNFSVGDPLKVDFKFKSGESFTVPIGYEFGNGVSLSLSAGYDRVSFQQLTGEFDGDRQKASTQGHLALVPVMANAAYRVQIIGKLSWYIGAGLGAVHETASFHTYDNDADRSITFGRLGARTAVFDGITDNSWRFSYQAFTGLSYELFPHASLKVGYRFMQVDNRVTVNGASSSNLIGQSAEAGLLWKF